MPLDLSLAATSALMSPHELPPSVAIEETLLLELPAKLGVHAPIWQQLAAAAFDDPEVDARDVADLAAEVRLLRERWLASEGDRADPTRDTLDQILALCDAALAAEVGLDGVSD
jgi:hypothetical protein